MVGGEVFEPTVSPADDDDGGGGRSPRHTGGATVGVCTYGVYLASKKAELSSKIKVIRGSSSSVLLLLPEFLEEEVC